MKTISMVKKAVCGVIAAGSTLLIAACYGVYSTKDLAQGSVTVPEGTPDQYNVMVCAEFGVDDRTCAMVNTDGTYYLSTSIDSQITMAEQEGYQLCAEDENGVFLPQCVDVPATSVVVQQDFDLEFTPQVK